MRASATNYFVFCNQVICQELCYKSPQHSALLFWSMPSCGLEFVTQSRKKQSWNLLVWYIQILYNLTLVRYWSLAPTQNHVGSCTDTLKQRADISLDSKKPSICTQSMSDPFNPVCVQQMWTKAIWLKLWSWAHSMCGTCQVCYTTDTRSDIINPIPAV